MKYTDFNQILGLYCHYYSQKPILEKAYRVAHTGVFYNFSKQNPSGDLSTYPQKDMLQYINEGTWIVFENQEEIHQEILELNPNYRKEFLIYETL